MRREIRTLEISEGVHLEGLGNLSKMLPMRTKDIKMKMYYDSKYPNLIIIHAMGQEHFLSMENVKSGTFDSPIEGSVL